MIASVLIAQDADQPTAAKELNRLLKTFAAIEQHGAGAATYFSYMRINETVAEFLVNRADANGSAESRNSLSEQFPTPEMTQH